MNAMIHSLDGSGRRTARPFTVAAARVARRERQPHPLDSYVLGPRLLSDTLVRERKRADRLDSSFAVIVIDRGHEPAEEGRWDEVLRAAVATRRDVDALGWLEQDTVLGLILPDASRDMAQRAMRRLQRRLVARLGADARALSMRMYIHGTAWQHSGVHLPPVSLLLDAFVPVRTHAAADAAKRGVDVVASLALLLLFAPVMLLAWLAVKLTSSGPAFFQQERVGRRGEPFTMLKFRSMRANAGHAVHNDYVTWFITASDKQPRAGGEVFKMTNDPRITGVGQWLRKTSLDELPQFLNVLRGEMSLVGPRPPLPFEVDKYQPWHRRRVLEAKPGVTGLWQVNGRSRTTFDEMVRMDLEYSRTRTFWGDLRILAATPMAMVKGAG